MTSPFTSGICPHELERKLAENDWRASQRSPPLSSWPTCQLSGILPLQSWGSLFSCWGKPNMTYFTIKQCPARQQSRVPLRPWVTGEIQSSLARFGWDTRINSLGHLVGEGESDLVDVTQLVFGRGRTRMLASAAWFIPLHLTPSPRQPYTESVEEAAYKEWFERPCTMESKKVMKCEIRQREKTLEANFIFTLRPQLII